MGDDAKRRAFAAAAHASVQGRTWPALSAELVRHYRAVIAGDAVVEPAGTRRAVEPVSTTRVPVVEPVETQRGAIL
jgi:phosphatidylinositol alpha 1,6-mannosyltransferase